MSRRRSLVHMLEVAAARLEYDCANPELIKALRETAKGMAKRRAEGRDHTPEDQKRIDRQRTLMAMVMPSQSLNSLKAAMLQRAYDLLWDGDTSGCDALLEFLPSLEVDKLLDAWTSDVEPGDRPKSIWYASEARAA